MTQKDNSDLCEYGRPGRGVGVEIMLALLAGGLFWFGTRSSDEISDERLTPQRQSMGAGTMSGRERRANNKLRRQQTQTIAL